MRTHKGGRWTPWVKRPIKDKHCEVMFRALVDDNDCKVGHPVPIKLTGHPIGVIVRRRLKKTFASGTHFLNVFVTQTICVLCQSISRVAA